MNSFLSISQNIWNGLRTHTVKVSKGKGEAFLLDGLFMFFFFTPPDRNREGKGMIKNLSNIPRGIRTIIPHRRNVSIKYLPRNRDGGFL